MPAIPLAASKPVFKNYWAGIGDLVFIMLIAMSGCLITAAYLTSSSSNDGRGFVTVAAAFAILIDVAVLWTVRRYFADLTQHGRRQQAQADLVSTAARPPATSVQPLRPARRATRPTPSDVRVFDEQTGAGRPSQRRVARAAMRTRPVAVPNLGLVAGPEQPVQPASSRRKDVSLRPGIIKT